MIIIVVLFYYKKIIIITIIIIYISTLLSPSLPRASSRVSSNNTVSSYRLSAVLILYKFHEKKQKRPYFGSRKPLSCHCGRKTLDHAICLPCRFFVLPLFVNCFLLFAAFYIFTPTELNLKYFVFCTTRFQFFIPQKMQCKNDFVTGEY